MIVSAGQTAIDTRPADAKLSSYLTRPDPVAAHIMHILGFGTGSWLSAFVFAFSLSLADALPLPLKHHFPLKLRNGADDVEHHPARRSSRVDAHWSIPPAAEVSQSGRSLP
jgi:hypothetical protein